MSFSNAVRITDLDDFITPAQECIKPVKIENNKRKTARILIDNDGTFTGITEKGEKYKMEKVDITLNDCLACSGCVTSAETVLIKEQTTTEFFNKISQLKESCDKLVLIISIAPQSEASLSLRFNLGDVFETRYKLKKFFRSLHSETVVLSTTFGREFSLVEIAKNVKEKIESGQNEPIIASSCPGWVCYAEKHKENQTIVPLISTVKSPQQIMGHLVKHYLPERLSEYKDWKIFHCTIMPCFDKKLEASRDEFSFVKGDSQDRERDVDMVLSTAEIEALIQERQFDFGVPNLDDEELNKVEELFSCKNSAGQATIYSHEGTGSGGYIEFAMRFCANKLYGIDLNDVLAQDRRVNFKVLRNADFKEVSLVSESIDNPSTNQTLLTFAYAYGFRNIQTIVQRIRQKKCPYQFIEVMACPGGCLNGGGQIKLEAITSKDEQKLFLERVTEKYQSAAKQRPLVNENVLNIYQQMSNVVGFHTTYNIVPKIDIINPAMFKW